jgi:hypothetical protein
MNLFSGLLSLFDRKTVPKTMTYPSKLDLDSLHNVELIKKVKDDYSAVLMNERCPYNRCLFRPVSLLRHPKSLIALCLTALIDFSEGRKTSPWLDEGMIGNQDLINTLKSCLIMLDDFIEVDARSLPSDGLENIRAGTKYNSHSESA